MLQKILQILLILSLSLLIYLGNITLININLFLLIILSTLNKNYFSLFAIIPLFFINKTLLLIFSFLWILLFLVNKFIKKNLLKNISITLISVIYFAYELLINKTEVQMVLFLFLILSVLLLINILNISLSKRIVTEVLILSLSILNLSFINIYYFLFLYLILMLIEGIKTNKPYYLITSFLITCYAIYTTSNIIYLTIQIFAYLGYLFNFLIKKSNLNNDLEYVLEDINTNISNFCNFLNHFSKITYNNDYEKRVSSSIKILIESYCVNCGNRNICYANKKIKTYIYLKELLTKEAQINSQSEINNLFECKYYFKMAEAALDLQKKYNLITQLEVDNLKVYGVCSSVQNYFISMFEKISPKMIKLMNFKKVLIEQNIMFNDFESQIISETTFQFKISTKRNTDLLLIKDAATSYFKKNDITITMKENSLYIHPVKKYKVIYDSATLSLNNCQISGDNLLIKTINESNFLCALSDGMGSGFYAYQLSQETLKMVDNITNCNISFDAALQILNNFFKTKDLSDSYATLDLVNINLTDGILDLYKLGSSTTYISRGNKIIPIYNNNLPFGISDLVTKEEYSIADNDLIILVSDGINDYIDEGSLVKFIETIKDELPHKIVYEILQKIYYENKNQIKDDMSCIAIKIKSN